MTTIWLYSDYILATFLLHSDYILTTFWLHSGYNLTTFCLHSAYILVTFWIKFWLHSGYFFATFLLLSEYIPTTFWLHPDYILTTLGGLHWVDDITNFWSIAPDDHLSKTIYIDLRWLFDPVLLFILRLSCFSVFIICSIWTITNR